MDLQWLRDNGAITPGLPVVREVSWIRFTDAGEEIPMNVSVRVKRLSSGATDRVIEESRKPPARKLWAMLVAETVLLGDEGEERMSYEVALELDPTFAEALLEEAVYPVNPLGRRKGTAAKN